MAEDAGITWHVETHVHRERTPDWYWGLGLVALAGAALAIFFGNVLFAIIIAMGALSLTILIARGPREHQVRVDPRGVSMDGTLYRWSAVESFWVQEQRHPQLLVTTHGVLHPQLIIPLGDPTRARSVRDYCRRHAREEEQDAHLGEHVAEILGL